MAVWGGDGGGAVLVAMEVVKRRVMGSVTWAWLRSAVGVVEVVQWWW